MTKDEILKDLRATFPKLTIEWVEYDWHIHSKCGAVMSDRMPFFGGYEDDGYTNSIHDAFLAWLENRGYYLESEDYIWYQLAPLPSPEIQAMLAENARRNAADPNFECPF